MKSTWGWKTKNRVGEKTENRRSGFGKVGSLEKETGKIGEGVRMMIRQKMKTGVWPKTGKNQNPENSNSVSDAVQKPRIPILSSRRKNDWAEPAFLAR
jgi:hypothetical protein